MEQTLELVEVRVSSRTRWHVLVLRQGSLTAVGECSDSGDPAGLVRELDLVRRLLGDHDLVAERATILDRLTSAVVGARGERGRGRSGDRGFVLATLMGGVDQLLVDLASQLAGEPTWKWLGAAAPEPVRLYANINRMPGGRSPADVGEMAREAVRAGFGSVKCAPFDVPVPGQKLGAVGLERIRAVRAAIGDDVALKVDCHEHLSLQEVHGLLPHLEDLGIDWLEDAVGIADLDGLRGLRAATALTLAGGEVVFDLAELEPVLGEGLLDVLMPDLKHAGGIDRVRAMVGLAAGASPAPAISPHNPTGPVATAASAHLVAASPGATVLELQFGETSRRSELVGGLERIEDGYLVLSDRPGLGVTLPEGQPHSRVLWSTTI